MEDKSRKGPAGRLRFEHEEQAVTSGQLGPKSKKRPIPKSEPPPISDPPGASPPVGNRPGPAPPKSADPATSGQVGPKSGKLRQDSNKPRPSKRLWRDGEPLPGGEAAEDAPHTGPANKKATKDGKRMEKSKLRMEKNGERLNTAREKLANQKPPKKPGPIKTVGRAAKFQTWRYVHGKIHQVERENAGIEAAHKTELAGEHLIRGGTRFIKKRIRTRPARQVRKWERKAISAKADYAYRQLVQENPGLKSNPLSRLWQKRQLKKQYRKQAKEAAKTGAKAAKKTAVTAKNIAGAAWRFVRSNPKVILILTCAFLLIVVLQSCMGALTTIGNGLIGAVGGTSYGSSDSDIEAVEADYTTLEKALRDKLARIERDYPSYDEYRYSVDEIGHDPFELASYLTAKYDDYTPAKVRAELQYLLEQQYTLTITETVEVRYRTETRTDTWTETDPETGETTTHSDTYEVEVPYNYYILNVSLRNTSLGAVALANLDPEQTERYLIYQKTKGNRPNLFEGNIYTHPGEYTDYDIPPEALSDPAFAALIAEAEKYLGYPYVWGGSSPSTSFDCSGFVSWVVNHSGWNVGRLGAQGLFNICTPVSSANARPGDLIFFVGTYDTPGVSHVGIYVGGGMMLHCGNPIGYASVETNYWQSHYYSFGRLP
ncbi:C40 family peptidase [Paenibacillus sp. HN-1]|uniref:CD1108 family mobile element protein n=1 Tax=Paenibacillus TaxID=44249 RepID=UPI001CA9AD6A|nr:MULTISPECIES: NlpC/P60 family protein [Paenibacillus]MBY9077762.1 C40 family peptidase [Paenibacillus sp. CGMCC 1.18879]MBY9083659.1 C40 family peptidase [Paenibacillus sinensis]